MSNINWSLPCLLQQSSNSQRSYNDVSAYSDWLRRRSEIRVYVSLSYCVSQCVLCDRPKSMGERECPFCIREEDQSNFPLCAPKLVRKTFFSVLSGKIVFSRQNNFVWKNPTLFTTVLNEMLRFFLPVNNLLDSNKLLLELPQPKDVLTNLAMVKTVF